MSKFRKRPVVIEAVPFSWDNRAELCELMGDLIPECSPLRHDGLRPAKITFPIETLEGTVTAYWDDNLPLQWWIIKGIQGEFYPCKADIFEETYASVEEFGEEGLDDDSIPCIICEKELKTEWSTDNDFNTWFPVYGGVLCRTRGNFGSTAYDPFGGEYVEFAVCDKCYEKVRPLLMRRIITNPALSRECKCDK